MRDTPHCFAVVSTIAASLLIASSSQAILDVVGEQDFADGDQVGVLDYQNAQANEDPLLHEIQGIDGSSGGVTFDLSWTFSSYGPVPVGNIVSAAITIGIYEHDSAENNPVGGGLVDQVDAFSVDGNDLTGGLNALFEASGGTVGFFTTEYNVYTLALPGSLFADLADGSATFALRLKNGWGPTISGPNNSGGLDFSQLDIAVVPEPSPGLLLALSGFGLALSLTRHGAGRRPHR